MGLLSRLLLVVTAGVMLAGTARAQFPNIGGNLLDMPDVQKELKITDDQKDKIKKAQADVRAKMKDDFDKLKDLKPREQITERLKLNMKVNAEAAKEYDKILTEDQRKRLKQIETQAKGVGAFTDGDVTKELKLTDDQKKEVAKITEEMAKEMQKIAEEAQAEAQKGNIQGALEAVKKVQDASKKAKDKAVDTLDSDQKKKWKELTGDPFDLKLQFPGLGGLGK